MGLKRFLRKFFIDEVPASDNAVSLKENYSIAISRSYKIPGTFTRERPSYIVVDICWIFMAFLSSVVFSAVQLRTRRDALWFVFKGHAKDLDFRKVGPDLAVKYLSKHKDMIQEAIDSANTHIRFLAFFIDPMPQFIANPPKLLVASAGVIFLCFIFRFWAQHRNWRYNTLLVIVAYAMYVPINWLSPADTQMAILLVVSWIFPMHMVLSIIIHNALRDNKWKPLRVILQLNPKRDAPASESGDEDSALLNYDEIARKENE